MSAFCEKIYSLTKKIPRGKVATYGQLAKLAGFPKAARAVGRCISQNPDPTIIPCHRVVAATGKLTGYAFGAGIKTKKELLTKEGVVFRGECVDLSSSIWNV
jgi:O-6-methylguanine DNA methyltransferase